MLMVRPVHTKKKSPVAKIILIGFLSATMGLLLGSKVTLAAEAGADEVFSRYKNQVVQVRIVEASSRSKSTVGSGFLVSPTGHIVTNYHVVALLIHKPDQYRGEIVHHDDHTSPLTLLNFDAIHDLAIVQSEREQPSYFKFQTESMDKGERVYSMGNPWDLGMTIVEGTYSGLLERTLYEKIHFTGSLNAGMSGGPAVTSEGKVLGVNVASAGDQLSFLVPAKFANGLVEKTLAEPYEKPKSLLLKLRDQLLRHQDAYLSSIISQAWDATSLGPYAVPGKIASFVKCWGSSAQRKKWLYETVTQSCSFEDGIYLSKTLSTGTLQFTHTYVSSERLNRFRFYSLYQSFFQNDFSDDIGKWFEDEEEVGAFRCLDDFVAPEGPSMKVVFCVRGYKKLPGLYDSVFKVATVDNNHQGLQGKVTLTGVSFENAQAFGRKFLENARVSP